MIFWNNLENLVFNRHQFYESDELIIISGYIGPGPIIRLKELPFPVKVIYGLYGAQGIKRKLHNEILDIQDNQPNTTILYSILPIHSKCYMWMNHQKIVHALIGSANFSTSGLNTEFKEVLAETTLDTFSPLNVYINLILKNSINCKECVPSEPSNKIQIIEEEITEYCRMTLLDPNTNEVQKANGLNWGQNPKNHTNPDDANIPIRSSHISNYPELFPPKSNVSLPKVAGGRSHRQNEAIDIIWDDGENMKGLLEGNYQVNNLTYPKQISSFPSKSTLGKYIRKRIGVREGERVTRKDLENYGRTNIDVSLQSEGVYYFDFSVNKS